MELRVSGLILLGLICSSVPTPGEAAVKGRCRQLLRAVVEEQGPTERALQQATLSLLSAPIVVSELGVSGPVYDHGIAAVVGRLDTLFEKVVALLRPQYRDQARAIYREQRYVYYTHELSHNVPSSWMLGLKFVGGGRLAAQPEVWLHQGMKPLRLFKRLHLFEFAVRFGLKSEFIAGNPARAAVLEPGHDGPFKRYLDSFIVEFNRELYQHVPLEVARAELSAYCGNPPLQAILFADFKNRRVLSLAGQLEMREALDRQALTKREGR